MKENIKSPTCASCQFRPKSLNKKSFATCKFSNLGCSDLSSCSKYTQIKPGQLDLFNETIRKTMQKL